MPILLNRSPFPKNPGEVAVRGERVPVRSDQIIIWVSLTDRNIGSPSPSAIPFPAILDTGHNHTFSISERHLTNWAGLSMNRLEISGAIRDRKQRLTLRLANLWVHPNASGQREPLAEGLPQHLKAKIGIAVYPGSDFPRLPILGLRAIAENDLVLNVNGPKREATLRTAGMWWPFA